MQQVTPLDWRLPLQKWTVQQLFDTVFSLRSFGNAAYPDGLFPSTRWHPLGYSRHDNSAYFTAGLLFNLQRLGAYLIEAQHQLIRQQINAMEPVFDLYQNRAGRDTYNFWQTKPPGHFSNGKLLGRWEFFRPPDDADDSVMIYQVLNKPAENRAWLLQFIDAHANLVKHQVKHMPECYTTLPAWTTFFVRDMPAGFDACVMSNLIGFALQSQLPFSNYGLATIRFLELTLERGDWLQKPEIVSPYYPFPFVIAYHLSRLIVDFPGEPKINKLAQLLKQALKPLPPQTGFARMLQYIASRNLNLEADFPGELPLEAVLDAPFFVLPLSLEFHGTWAKWLARKHITHLRFSCPAFNVGLALEATCLYQASLGQ